MLGFGISPEDLMAFAVQKKSAREAGKKANMALFMPKPKPAFNAWPDVDPGQKPIGCWVICQYKLVEEVTGGGIIRPEQTREDDQYGVSAVRVVAIGPLAFHDLATGEPYPKAPWYEVGDFVRIPMTGLARWSVKSEHGDVHFVTLKDEHVRTIDTAEAREYAEKWAQPPG